MFKFFKRKTEVTSVEEKTESKVAEVRKPISIEDIKDEDMMVAALIATIDYAEEVKTDIRLKSIKQIS